MNVYHVRKYPLWLYLIELLGAVGAFMLCFLVETAAQRMVLSGLVGALPAAFLMQLRGDRDACIVRCDRQGVTICTLRGRYAHSWNEFETVSLELTEHLYAGHCVPVIVAYPGYMLDSARMQALGQRKRSHREILHPAYTPALAKGLLEVMPPELSEQLRSSLDALHQEGGDRPRSMEGPWYRQFPDGLYHAKGNMAVLSVLLLGLLGVSALASGEERSVLELQTDFIFAMLAGMGTNLLLNHHHGATGGRFAFDAQGIEVKTGKFRRSYSWTEFRYVHEVGIYADSTLVRQGEPGQSVVILSPRALPAEAVDCIVRGTGSDMATLFCFEPTSNILDRMNPMLDAVPCQHLQFVSTPQSTWADYGK